ncbi:hypothetical protein D5272_13280 [bacterium D16-76]|nr:hypothetical protein [bacterium D16-76]
MVIHMLEKAAIAMTEFMYKKGVISLSKRPTFIYGFQLILSALCSSFSILTISILLGKPLSALMFFIVFFWTRLFSGGFHANTYLRCFFLTNVVYLLVVLISEILFRFSSIPLLLSAQILSGLIVLFFAPIRHRNHPLSETIYMRNQKVSRCLVAVFELLFPCLSFLTGSLIWMSLFSASLMAVAILMIVPKIQERRNQYE